MTTPPRNPTKKTRGRPFQPGNPGKPAGARRKVTAAALALIEARSSEIVAALIEAALSGDTAAGRALLDRLAAPIKGRPVQFAMPPVATAADIAAAMAAIVKAVAAGDLTPDEGTAIAGLVNLHRQAIETVDLEARLAALEDATKEPRR